MVKQLTAIVLCIAFVLALIGKTAVFINFRVNQEFIARTLCEMKTQKSSTCKGNCQLKKQLKKADGDEETPATPLPTIPKEYKEIKEALIESNSLVNINQITTNQLVINTPAVSLFSVVEQNIPHPPPKQTAV